MPDFYTRTGDDGYTGILGEGRLPKYHAVIEAVGAVDEASAALGMARAAARGDGVPAWILSVQRDLYHLMSELAASPEISARFRQVDTARVAWLEELTDSLGRQVDLKGEFILPGDSPSGAALAVARTVVRRAERRVARLYHEVGLENESLLRYLNRLSSLLFVLELYENRAWGKDAPTLAKEG